MICESARILCLVFLSLFCVVDVKSALHKKRKDGKKVPLQKLTTMQKVYISRLILRHGDNYEVHFHYMRMVIMVLLSNKFSMILTESSA